MAVGMGAPGEEVVVVVARRQVVRQEALQRVLQRVVPGQVVPQEAAQQQDLQRVVQVVAAGVQVVRLEVAEAELLAVPVVPASERAAYHSFRKRQIQVYSRDHMIDRSHLPSRASRQ